MTTIQGHSEGKYANGQRHASSEQLGWDNILVERWTHAPGHMNDTRPEVTEIIVMLAGCIKVRRRGDGRLQRHHALPGTIWICPAGIQEDMIKVEGSSFDAVHMFLPSPLLSETALEEYDLDPTFLQLQYDGGFQDPLIEQMGRAIVAELDKADNGSQLVVDNLQAALSAYVVNNHSSVSHLVSQEPLVGALDNHRLKRVTTYIKDNIGDSNLRLADLAAEAGLSKYHFSRLFKNSTGCTPHAYVVGEQLTLAKSLLTKTKKSLDHVAQLSGFSSHSQMARVFNRNLGITPASVRSGATKN